MMHSFNEGHPALYIETLGCAKNVADSRRMEQDAHDAGYRICDDVQQADAIIVNTCSFIQSATEESIECVLDVLENAQEKPDPVPVIVCGCMPARYGDDLISALPEVARFLPCKEEDSLVKVLDELLGRPGAHEPDASNLVRDAFAYVKISDGCDRWCSFCTIPKIRGRYRSFPVSQIEEQVSHLVASGIKEIVLIGQDTGVWGKDLPEKVDTAYLLDRLARAYPDTWFRIMYMEPDGVTDRLLDVMDRHENICNYLDIPLQHVVPRILKKMNRNGSAEAFLDLIRHIRSRIPRITLRTTLMSGFPGETEEDHEALLRFVQEANVDHVGVFAYSQEGGTRAADLPDQIPEEVKQMRASEVRSEADAVSSSIIHERIGSEAMVLVEGVEEDGQIFGRAESQAPEVDGITYVDKGEVGSFERASIVDTFLYDMEGEVQ